jgi:hypothetical protein
MMISNKYGQYDVSAELGTGIARSEAAHRAEIESLGGYGAEITGTGPDGVRRSGVLAPAHTMDQRPHLVTADGKHYRCAAYEIVT